MPERQMFRYVVPVDDEAHEFTLTGDPVAVAVVGTSHVVEFWAEHDGRAGGTDRAFQVFGTGHPITDGAQWVGTCPRTSLGLVWHLYEVKAIRRGSLIGVQIGDGNSQTNVFGG
jgi:hypothetical protein